MASEHAIKIVLKFSYQELMSSFQKVLISQLFIFSFVVQSCTNHKKVYKSDCDVDMAFKRIGFTQLIDSIKYYDRQYVEITGTYKEAKEQSALFNDSLFVDHSNKHALWINFSQDCPLYLSGTHTGLFQAIDGQFIPINNKEITIRGKVNRKNTGYLGQYRGCIERVSFVEL